MAEIVIAPLGKDAIQMGTLIDDDGQRFVAMLFDTPEGDKVTITMLIPLFQAFAQQAGKLAQLTASRDHWRNHPRG